VVTGRLSLVGPRPEMPFLSESMDARFVEVRTRAKPGCTGMWQISPWADRLIGEAPQYDRWYVSSANLRVDAWVLWRTALLMLRLGGPAELDDVPRWATWRPVQATAPALAESPPASATEAA
jgi:lipopolysaccharide/colanic/teichoic acid biosynthesis glycosyltransferase